MTQELRTAAATALACPDPAQKVALSLRLSGADWWPDPNLTLEPGEVPGRPLQPTLVPPQRVPRRRPGSPAGRAALIHAIAHIEFNAINLALDAVARFAGMPVDFYRDWARVAAEEARHFALLTTHLATLGHAYGDFVAHDGLWEAARKTRDDVLARMALVPRILEARGLDVTPAMQHRLRAAGDDAAAGILEIILQDEIGHVAVGNRWFLWLCAARGVASDATFTGLCSDYGQALPRPPFNVAARLAGGFSAVELADWERGDGSRIVEGRGLVG